MKLIIIVIAIIKNNMKKLLLTSLFITSTAFGLSGEKIAPEDWKDGKIHLSKKARDTILFLSHNDPIIQKIPVKDNGEPLVDLREKNHPRIKLITDIPNYNLYLQPILPGDIKNIKKGDYAKVRLGFYERLVKTLDYLPENIGLAYAFGHLTQAKVEEKFDYLMMLYHKIYLDKDLAYNTTNHFIMSNTGGHILTTLFDIKENKILNLGVVGSRPNNLAIKEFADDTTEEQRKYRAMLEEATTKAGLVGYGEQWSTFHYGDKAWAYVKGAKEAIYDLIEKDKKLKYQDKEEYLKNFDPIAIAKKYENCDIS
jgi:D-alanyl-D-alanine dipeptidase